MHTYFKMEFVCYLFAPSILHPYLYLEIVVSATWIGRFLNSMTQAAFGLDSDSRIGHAPNGRMYRASTAQHR